MVDVTPRTEEEIIEEEVVAQAKRIWGGPRCPRKEPWRSLPYTYCTLCGDYDIKRPCVCSVVDGSALCARHWISWRIKERLAEAREKKKVVSRVVLDVDDFARI